jgi:DNA-binding protein WhiA
MALTAQVKDELNRVEVRQTSQRRAEVSTLLRFAGGLHLVSGRVVIEAEVDDAATAQRIRTTVADVFGQRAEMLQVSGGGLRKGEHYVVRVVRDAASAVAPFVDCRPAWSTAPRPTPRPCGVVRSSPTVR